MSYDVIVVGGGHAGCEAAAAAARLGCRTCLVTMNIDTIAAMSCNPAIGGPAAKSHLVREIDALGGIMGQVIDRSYLNIRLINESRGPAVQALRAQADKKLYQREILACLLQEKNIQLKQGLVTGLRIVKGKVAGVILNTGVILESQAVILATGTFLNGRIVMGDKEYSGGRQAEPAAVELGENLKSIGLEVKRFQTATPPRLDGRTVNYTKLNCQPPDSRPWQFSFYKPRYELDQRPCWWTQTTPETIRFIQENLSLSPIRSGIINTHGPSFCPSIDRKVLRFPEKTDHLIFLEPEGRFTQELYALGLTTAMPEEIQKRIIRSITGLEEAEIIRPGYAVEYDYLPGWQMHPWLENKRIKALYTAGQINGTSGYEEAAAQGLLAGINAGRQVKGLPPVVLSPTQAYMGVLVDDLTLKEHDEPYRMMTSLAEYRLHLRLDTADDRLTLLGYKIGLISGDDFQSYLQKQETKDREILRLAKTKAEESILTKLSVTPKGQNATYLRDLLMRPEIKQETLAELEPQFGVLSFEIRRKIEVELKFTGYWQRQENQRQAEELMEEVILPAEDFFSKNPGLSEEGLKILRKYSPHTLAKALRIPYLPDRDKQILPVLLKHKERLEEANGSL